MSVNRDSKRGYVMVVVLVVLAVLLSAGLFGIRAVESDLRAASTLKRSEILARAAEAGAAQRMSEISLASGDAGAALTTQILPEGTQWPPANTFTIGLTANEINEINQSTVYQVWSQPLVTVESNPPAGTQVGSAGQTTVWQVDSFASHTNQTTGGEHIVSVGVRLWSRGGQSYNN